MGFISTAARNLRHTVAGRVTAALVLLTLPVLVLGVIALALVEQINEEYDAHAIELEHETSAIHEVDVGLQRAQTTFSRYLFSGQGAYLSTFRSEAADLDQAIDDLRSFDHPAERRLAGEIAAEWAEAEAAATEVEALGASAPSSAFPFFAGVDRARTALAQLEQHALAEDVMQLRRIGDRRETLTSALAAVVAVVLAAALLMAWDVRRQLHVPLRTLERAAARIGEGDLQARVGALPASEFARLGHAFDDMATTLAASHELLEQRALYDDLTGLPNRTLFGDRLRHTVARERRSGGVVTVMFIDLDDFKRVNDSLGHAIGDVFLAEVSRRLASAVRDGDTVARLGGDEFAVLAELDDRDAAVALAQRLLRSLSPPLDLPGMTVTPAASIGVVATEGPDVEDPDGLLVHADLAMYAAKEGGKGSYRLYEPTLQQTFLDRVELEDALRHALNNDEVDVAFQPVVSLSTGTVRRVEALVRWSPIDRDPVAPHQLVATAEQSGLMVDLGRYVLDRALEGLTAIDRAGPGKLRLAVNVSPSELEDPQWAPTVMDRLRSHDVAADRLTFEVTESAVMHQPLTTIANLQKLRDVGAQVAIDDFGTGYSSLGRLASLPVDELKIDRSFLPLPGDDAVPAVLRAAAAVAQDMALPVVAEGIEAPSQLAALRALGCQMGQGYLFSKPVPLHHLLELLSSHPARWRNLAGPPSS